MNIAESLKQARKRKGLTQDELAYRSGVSQSAISDIESGKRTNPTADTLGCLAAALDVSILALYDPKEN